MIKSVWKYRGQSSVRQNYPDKHRVTVDRDYNQPVSSLVSDILKAAAECSDNPTEAVLQNLIEAKHQLRFPRC
ncbi:DUF4928 family protein [Escherichia coli]|uniref:DUF4928 family protein n=2 Tax=Escherichia coli TaxID=562 RepID=UPI0021AFEB0E|nr:DUF4928 family protein [Escherichia coli]